ncbi:MAG TPA: Lrp/AsnC family transcriptional regulator [Solirubrobacteraceae bacterium]|nr:Lrp/AsnC family transcriptional regulator [Solirubrobacteraceae bacterium]
MPLDSVDRRMLEILQHDGRISNAALAEQLHLSPSPCLRRLRTLEREGVIRAYRAELDRARLGLGLTVFIDLKIEGHSEHTAEAISKVLLAAPEVISAHIVSGSADFRLEVAVPDLAGYERFMFDTLLKLPNLGDIQSNFALRTVKSGAPLPLGEVPAGERQRRH